MLHNSSGPINHPIFLQTDDQPELRGGKLFRDLKNKKQQKEKTNKPTNQTNTSLWILRRDWMFLAAVGRVFIDVSQCHVCFLTPIQCPHLLILSVCLCGVQDFFTAACCT